jgi:hypothetical protein
VIPIEQPVAWRHGMFYHEAVPKAETARCGITQAGSFPLGDPRLGNWVYRPCPNCYTRAASTWITNLADTAAILGSSAE